MSYKYAEKRYGKKDEDAGKTKSWVNKNDFIAEVQ